MSNFRLIIVTFSIFLTILGKKQRILTVDRADICYISENAPYKLHYFNLRHSNRTRHDYYISASGEVLELLEGRDLAVDLQVIKCASQESPDTCENVHNMWRVSNICQFIEMKGLGVREIMDFFTPPVRCPLKGNYSAEEIRWNSEKFTLYPIDGYYWKLKFNGYWKKRLVTSLCIEAAVKSVEIQDNH